MKFSYNLLAQFVKISVTPQKLGELLTAHAFEVEDIYNSAQDFEGIISAKVVDVQKHPNADRLRVVTLDSGVGQITPVVCGAFNFGVGDMVALALPGAKIAQNIHSETHEPFTLDKATIRGIQSQGMICAEFELGLTDKPGDKPEIMLLPKTLKPGTPLSLVLNQAGSDWVLNIALPSNRPDAFSHLGLAREISAILKVKVKEPKPELKTKLSKTWKVKVLNKLLCPAYYGVKMKVRIGPSPKFIQELLTEVGMRPINNVVDITNFVMMELGQPTHAFDSSKVKGNITVRTARANEKFLALNHKEYILHDDTLVISDDDKTLALAAIIGGKESEVADSTTEIILEVANFQGTGVRKTCKKLGIKTEGSVMWEKGIHPKLAELGLSRAIALLRQYADAQILEFAAFTTPIKKAATVKFSQDSINKLLGTDLTQSQIKSYLERYGIKVKAGKKPANFTSATPPWWRADISNYADLAEEVLKLYGYNKVKPQPLNMVLAKQLGEGQESGTNDQYQIKLLFSRLGYFEVQNYNFISQKDILNFGGKPEEHVQIQNPLSEDQRFLKRDPAIPLLKNICLNQNRHEKFKLFELGKKYFGYLNEPRILSLAAFSKHSEAEKMVMSMKDDVIKFLNSIGITDTTFPTSGDNNTQIQSQEKNLGSLEILKKQLLKNFDIEGSVILATLSYDAALRLKKDIMYQTISKYPEVSRDISIIVDGRITWGEIENIVRPVSDLVLEITLFEAPFLAKNESTLNYHKNLEKEGKKNLGIRLTLGSFGHTLTEPEIAGILQRIVLKLQQELKAEVR
jgi:phenylalanyl-tRNA synthetase beta chain